MGKLALNVMVDTELLAQKLMVVLLMPVETVATGMLTNNTIAESTTPMNSKLKSCAAHVVVEIGLLIASVVKVLILEVIHANGTLRTMNHAVITTLKPLLPKICVASARVVSGTDTIEMKIHIKDNLEIE